MIIKDKLLHRPCMSKGKERKKTKEKRKQKGKEIDRVCETKRGKKDQEGVELKARGREGKEKIKDRRGYRRGEDERNKKRDFETKNKFVCFLTLLFSLVLERLQNGLTLIKSQQTNLYLCIIQGQSK